MHRQGHVGAALLAYAPVGATVASTGAPRLAVAGALVCGWLSSVPDWDQRVPMVGHRGGTHTVAFALAVGAVVGVAVGLVGGGAGTGGEGVARAPDAVTVAPDTFWFGVGVLSVLSHVAADALTPAGVRPLWPASSRRIALALAAADDPLANYLLAVLGAAATAGWVWAARGGPL